jgi:hypothetical protein
MTPRPFHPRVRQIRKIPQGILHIPMSPALGLHPYSN